MKVFLKNQSLQKNGSIYDQYQNCEWVRDYLGVQKSWALAITHFCVLANAILQLIIELIQFIQLLT